MAFSPASPPPPADGLNSRSSALQIRVFLPKSSHQIGPGAARSRTTNRGFRISSNIPDTPPNQGTPSLPFLSAWSTSEAAALG